MPSCYNIMSDDPNNGCKGDYIDHRSRQKFSFDSLLRNTAHAQMLFSSVHGAVEKGQIDVVVKRKTTEPYPVED